MRLDQETIWLSLNQLSELLARDKSVISRHLRNIFRDGELEKSSTVALFATVQKEGQREVARNRTEWTNWTRWTKIPSPESEVKIDSFESFDSLDNSLTRRCYPAATVTRADRSATTAVCGETRPTFSARDTDKNVRAAVCGS